MKSTFFDRDQDLVIIEAHLVGPRSDARLKLVLDTGASNTIVTRDVIDQIAPVAQVPGSVRGELDWIMSVCGHSGYLRRPLGG